MNTKTFSAFLVALLAGIFQSPVCGQFEGNSAVDVSYCAGQNASTDAIQWHQLLFVTENNKTVTIGQNMTAFFNATLKSPLQSENPSAKLYLQVKYNSITLLRQWTDFCPVWSQLSDAISDANSQWPDPNLNKTCPLQPDLYAGNLTVSVPDTLPRGRYALLVRLNQSDTVQATCLQMNFRLD